MTRIRRLTRVVFGGGLASLLLVWSAGATLAATAPNTTITGGPAGTISTHNVTFTFASSRTNSTFKCSMDGSSWAACTSPKSYSALATGSHTFRVRAQNGTLVDQTPAVRTFAINNNAPKVTIKQGPGTTTTLAYVTFYFYADKTDVTFECKLDRNAWKACSSPWKTYAGSADQQHVFKVRATDAAGNVGLPASYDYTRFA